jgi:type 1 glutamine amidotransferase
MLANRFHLVFFVLLVGFLTLSSVVFLATESQRPKHKILYLDETKGYHHEILAESEKILKEIGEKAGAFETVVTQDSSQINAKNLEQYDAVVFYTTGELPFSSAEKQALLDFVKSGKGFIGIHSATDTCYQWPQYGEMLGGYFDEHPWTQEVNIIVEDATHPATKHLAPSFKIFDEIYQYKDFSKDKVHVLLRLDNNSVDLNKENVKRADRYFAIAWTRSYGKGRVFFTGLGHDEHCWRDPRYQEHLLNGIRWAMKDVE